MSYVTKIIAGSVLTGGVIFGVNRAFVSLKSDAEKAFKEVTQCALTEAGSIVGQAAKEVIEEKTEPLRAQLAKDIAFNLFVSGCPIELREELRKAIDCKPEDVEKKVAKSH